MPNMTPEEIVKELEKVNEFIRDVCCSGDIENKFQHLTAAITRISSLPKEAKKERPEVNEDYYFINGYEYPVITFWLDADNDRRLLKIGNCYFGPNAQARAELEVRRRKLYQIIHIPKEGEEYFTFHDGDYAKWTWNNNSYDKSNLSIGRIRATRDEAKACAKEEQAIAEELIKLNS